MEKDKLLETWRSYIFQGELEDNLDERIKKSWQRCTEYKINPLGRTEINVLSKNDLQNRLDKYAEVVRVATPIMKELYQTIKGSNFMVLLTDAEGYILKSIGDDSFMPKAQQVHLIEGANWHERLKGTNAIGTAIEEETALNVYANEHYFEENHFLTCSAAPIFDAQDNLIGVIDVSGNYHSAHQHTLGMVVAAANAIKQQLVLENMKKELTIPNKTDHFILNSDLDGYFTITNDGVITQINQRASQLLGYPQKDCINKNLNIFFSGSSFSSLMKLITSQQKIHEDVVWNLNQEKLQVISQVRKIFNQSGEATGLVIKIDDFASYTDDKRTEDLLKRIQQIFSDLIINAEDSQQIINALNKFINIDIACYNIYFDNFCVEASSAEFADDLNKLELEDILTKYQYDEIKIDNEVYSYLIYCNQQRLTDMNDEDKIALEYAKHSLKLNIQKKISEHQIRIRYREQLLQDLIFDNILSLEDAQSKIDHLYGWTIEDKLVTIIFGIDNLEEEYLNLQYDFKQSLEDIKHRIYLLIEKKFKDSFPHIMYTIFSDNILLVVESSFSRREFEKEIKKIIKEVKEDIQKNYQLDLTIGISNYRSSLMKLNECYREAKTAVRFSRKWYDKDRTMFYNQLGVYKALDYIAQTDIGEELYQFYLGSLIDYDKEHNTELLHTLRHLIINNWNMKETAQKLFIHYNTMKYRVKKIEEILDIDLNDSDQKFNLNLALKLLQLLQTDE